MKKDFIKTIMIKNLPVILAFLIPIGILLGVYIIRGVFPFGDNMFLRSDMYHQYAPFMKEFQRKLQEGGSLLYSWNIGLGSNFASTYAYYLASPFNWLVGFFPEYLIPEFMNLMIILKSGFMSAAFCWYLVRRFQRNDLSASVFGLFYALSSYMAAYAYNVMWLDCLILFPLILAGLEDLVKRGKYRLYVLSLGFSIISNYYISIMISIFLIIYFLYLIVCEIAPGIKKEYLRHIVRFVLFSLLAGGLAMFLVLPALFNLIYTASAESAFPTDMKAYFNLLELISHAGINEEVSMFETKLPNIYCTMALFILVPLYWIIHTIPFREKAGKTILLSILLFSFMYNIPTYIWHGFHFPNSLPGRHSFIYIMMILTIGYQTFLMIGTFRKKEILLSMFLGVCGVFLFQQVSMEENNTVENASVGALFIIIYAALFLSIVKGIKRRKLYLFILFSVSILEISVNTLVTGYQTNKRFDYMKDQDQISELKNRVDTGDFFRIEKISRKTKNDGAWNGYHSASVFSSTAYAGNSDLYNALGLQGKVNGYSFYGNTPFTQALLGVKYVISDKEKTDALLTETAVFEGSHLYEYRYALPLGFMIKRESAGSDQLSDNPFINQNEMIRQFSGEEAVFELYESIQDKIINLNVRSEGRCMIYIPTPLEKCSIFILRDRQIVDRKDLDHLESPWILDVGDVKKGDRVTVLIGDDDVDEITVFPAVMDYAKYEKAMQALSAEPLTITSFSDTCLEGNVTVKQEGILFTTIPYDPGWALYVDGGRMQYSDYKGSFIMLHLEEGEHHIELRYWPKGLTSGIMISILSLAVLMGLEVICAGKERKWKIFNCFR